MPGIRLLGALLLLVLLLSAADSGLPDHLIPRRSSQVHDGFGINSDLPREPYLPWNRWWWTRLFDAGINFIRIGQYENSSDYTSWDWVERKRGEYSVVPELDDYVDSLVENGVHIEVQLLYGNPLYTSRSGRPPEVITPEPGSFHNPDRSIYSVFWPPTTPTQIAAFTRYVAWMVNHFRGRVEYYEIWNEPNIEYWNPAPNPEDYGRLFKASADAIHKADPRAKAVFGGLAGADVKFAKRALDACRCASSIDIFAYHNYPAYGHNLNPEAEHSDADTNPSSRPLRDMLRAYPGIRRDLVFWNDEFNDGLPTWQDSDESVQAKYTPRGLVIDRAEGVRTFVWLLAGATDGNEFDDFGMLHGVRYKPDDFAPRPVYRALQNTNALFSDAHPDPSIRASFDSADARVYTFRTAAGKAIVAYWLPVLSRPGDQSPPRRVGVRLANSGITRPVLVDVVSGKLTALAWKGGSSDTLDALPLTDSINAIVDRSFFDWSEIPEAPSGLTARANGNQIQLAWQNHGGSPNFVLVERRIGWHAAWEQRARVTAESFSDELPASGTQPVFYRVRAGNDAGRSAYSNIARAQ
ncbi:MAG TPA: hypothetical protein VH477_14565 [Bryobacteraceae bacterium]